jgi:glycosyltransferase involved in cell wall biosynthesis
VIVDQGSTDRTVEIAASNGCVVIQLAKPRFYTPPAGSRNIGASATNSPILVHLDADMELGTNDFLDRLEALIDANHRAVVIRERDVGSGFWAECNACYRGTQMEAARAVTRDLFSLVGGYAGEISSGEDFFVTRLYEGETVIVQDDSLWVWHHIGRASLRSLIWKKYQYGKTAQRYLRASRRIGAVSAWSIVQASVRAYALNWRLGLSRPGHYLCIVPLRVMEFLALTLGMAVGAGQARTTPRDVAENS